MYKLDENIELVEIKDEMLVINHITSKVIKLNKTSKDILNEVKENQNQDLILEKLCSIYNVKPDNIRESVIKTLETFEKQSIIVKA